MFAIGGLVSINDLLFESNLFYTRRQKAVLVATLGLNCVTWIEIATYVRHATNLCSAWALPWVGQGLCFMYFYIKKKKKKASIFF